MEWLADPSIWMGLATLVVLEIVLGIDNRCSSRSLPTSYRRTSVTARG